MQLLHWRAPNKLKKQVETTFTWKDQVLIRKTSMKLMVHFRVSVCRAAMFASLTMFARHNFYGQFIVR